MKIALFILSILIQQSAFADHVIIHRPDRSITLIADDTETELEKLHFSQCFYTNDALSQHLFVLHASKLTHSLFRVSTMANYSGHMTVVTANPRNPFYHYLLEYHRHENSRRFILNY